MRSNVRCYADLRDFIETIPLVDCHDHSQLPKQPPSDPITAIIDFYLKSDLISASSEAEVGFILDETRSLEERWPVLERAWNRTRFTAYAEVARRGMRRFYGEEELSLDALKRMNEKLIDFSRPENYEAVLEQAGIVVRLVDIEQKEILSSFDLDLPPRSRPVISLPRFHYLTCFDDLQANTNLLGRYISSLDEYLDACLEIFTRFKSDGAVAFKDQSAYTRPIDYGNPTRAEAEAVFNWILADPRRKLSYPEGSRPLDDFLFQQFMRMARDLDLPVQIHTGHMAGVRNEITKTNAVHLTSLIELQRETRFDLFHANWPYSGELLFLAKNYPNVTIDFCWTNMIDPVYSQQMFRQAIGTIPHVKIHGYGSDLSGTYLASAWAHADLARDNIAMALSEMVETEYLNLDNAREIARGWLFDYPNAYFGLGLDWSEELARRAASRSKPLLSRAS